MSDHTILIVDDLPENVRALRRLLRGAYALKEAHSGSAALEFAAAQPAPDLVLLDIGMPDMDGFEVLRRLRESPTTASIPVIFLTGSNSPEDEARGIGLGAVDFISKPFSPEVVLSRVDSHLRVSVLRRDLERVSHTLGRYLPPQLVESIFRGDPDVKLGTRRKKLTVFFSDIVGFTQRTGSLEPEELTQLLNRYLNRMSDIVLRHGGTLDKFIGDSVMVFFGDPTTAGPEEDALACLRMAFDMRDAVQNEIDLRADNRSAEPFQIRMGIATGYCTVGNFGSEARMDYTIIGNQVNLASRLEKNAKPGQILIAHETWSLVRDVVYCVQGPPMVAKGFRHPVPVFDAVDLRENVRGDAVYAAATPGFSLSVDPHAIAPRDREAVREALRRAQELVENPTAVPPPPSTRLDPSKWRR